MQLLVRRWTNLKDAIAHWIPPNLRSLHCRSLWFPQPPLQLKNWNWKAPNLIFGIIVLTSGTSVMANITMQGHGWTLWNWKCPRIARSNLSDRSCSHKCYQPQRKVLVQPWWSNHRYFWPLVLHLHNCHEFSHPISSDAASLPRSTRFSIKFDPPRLGKLGSHTQSKINQHHNSNQAPHDSQLCGRRDYGYFWWRWWLIVDNEFQSQPCLTIDYTNGEILEGSSW